MSIFLLPKILDNNIGDNDGHDICFKMIKNVPSVIVSHSLYDSLCQTKIKIEKNDFGWDNYKKITNPFEFIHTIIPGYKTQVSKLTPLSRSFYKMIEMSTIFNLCNNNTDTNKYDNEIKFQNLLNDYVHNLSNNVRHMNDFEWYFNDSYYSDICGNGNPNENNINRGDVNSFNSGNSSMNSSSMFKNKNTVYEKKEKTTIFKNPLECNECKNENVQNENVQNENVQNENVQNENVQNENVQNENVQNENVQISYNNSELKDNLGSELKDNSGSELKDNSGSELKDNSENKFKSFHLAEGPGGFIEAVAHIRKNKKDEYYGMTLVNNDIKCPGWRNSKKFLEDNPNVIIEKGVDKTGNLLSRDNFIHCYDKYKNSMDLVTGDGGIDFSEDFNNQEYSATKLIIAQVVYALTLQSNDGNFVLKVFDTFSNAIIDVLYLLSSLYKSVYIMKPQTSRNANSERYVICKGYNLNENKERIDYIIEKIYDNFDNLNSSLYIETIFNFKNNRTFISKIEEINIIIGKKQIDNILTTLNIMMNKKFDKMDYYKKKHIQKCIRWCEIFDINFNKNLKSTNIFLSSTIEK